MRTSLSILLRCDRMLQCDEQPHSAEPDTRLVPNRQNANGARNAHSIEARRTIGRSSIDARPCRVRHGRDVAVRRYCGAAARSDRRFDDTHVDHHRAGAFPDVVFRVALPPVQHGREIRSGMASFHGARSRDLVGAAGDHHRARGHHLDQHPQARSLQAARPA
ncbi:hypothetical protein D9M72_531940 [compost metagenome]